MKRSAYLEDYEDAVADPDDWDEDGYYEDEKAELDAAVAELEQVVGACDRELLASCVLHCEFDLDAALELYLAESSKREKQSGFSKAIAVLEEDAERRRVDEMRFAMEDLYLDPSREMHKNSETYNKGKISLVEQKIPVQKEKKMDPGNKSAKKDKKTDSGKKSEVKDKKNSGSASVDVKDLGKIMKQKKMLLDKEEKAKTSGQRKMQVNLAVVGHVDAGKSTLTGHLLFLRGIVDKKTMRKLEKESKEMGKGSFKFAWVLDAHEQERRRGITVDIASKTFETENRIVTLVDAPGHRDFVPNMISGTCQADCAILVVDAIPGEFERGFQEHGQTKEHAILIRSLGVLEVIVAINKLDAVQWKHDRFEEIQRKVAEFLKSIGFQDQQLRFIPLSGLSGENVVARSAPELSNWYLGPTLLELIDECSPNERCSSGSFRLSIMDVHKTPHLGITASGKVLSGSVSIQEPLWLMPAKQLVQVKGLCRPDGVPLKIALTGDTVEVGLMDAQTSGSSHSPPLQIENIAIGDILCEFNSPISTMSCIEAEIITTSSLGHSELPLMKGSSVIFHLQSQDVPGSLSRIISVFDGASTRKARSLSPNTRAIVVIQLQRPICAEIFNKSSDFGRFLLRQHGRTIASGTISKALDDSPL